MSARMPEAKQNNMMSPQAVMNHHAKSFSWAARFLSRTARKDAALLYAFARTADDYADEDRLGSQQERLQCLMNMYSQALSPQLQGESSVASATGLMLRNYGVPDTVLQCFMQSLQADAGTRTIRNQQDLLRFAYGVAGTVGQMMRPILGAAVSSDSYAIALGVAMQLTNISRDVVEDAHRGRCYIPAEWGVSRQVMATPQTAAERTEAFAALCKLLALADDFYAYAQSGIEAIPLPNRRAIRIAAALYQAIGRKIVLRGPDHYWLGRESLDNFEKSWLILRIFVANTAVVPKVRDVWRIDLSHLVDTPGFPT